MPSLNHIHTYIKYKNRPGYFRCLDEKCTHFINKEMLIGKLSRCTLCGAEFTLNRFDLMRAKPRCLECSNTQKAIKARRDQEKAAALVNKVLETVEVQTVVKEVKEVEYDDKF